MTAVDTPALLVDAEKLENNIEQMAGLARDNGVKLRPHIKAHKSPWITARQLQAGAAGITAAKLGEAEVMAESGVEDIFLAYQVIGQEKWDRLLRLAERARVSVAIDSWQGGQLLNDYLADKGSKLDYLLEIDTGLKRCGLPPGDEAARLLSRALDWQHLNFSGIFTHAGHVYKASSPAEVARIGKEEGTQLVMTARMIEEAGINVPVISVGATPTVRYSAAVPGVTEIRPGNYVFYDTIQV
ncbi:MAG: alanine racemase, partial [Halanaerobium sp.]|nr:alanine racemase [Halanaerobium sp.]